MNKRLVRVAALTGTTSIPPSRCGADGSIPFVPQTREGAEANPSPGCKTPAK